MHMPLTPEANLCIVSWGELNASPGQDSLDELLGLDIGHAMHTGDAITRKPIVSR